MKKGLFLLTFFLTFIVTASLLAADADSNGAISTVTVYFLSPEEISAKIDKANRGDANSAFRLSQYYEFSDHSTESKENDLLWLKRASELGHPIAKYNLAYYYEYNAKPTNYKEAMKLYQEIASTDSSAMIAIAEMYQEGKGVNVSTNLAIQWYERAANKGKVFTMEDVALLLKNENKQERAYVWAKIADMRRNRSPQVRKDHSLLLSISSDLSSNTVSRLDEKAKDLDKNIPYIPDYTGW